MKFVFRVLLFVSLVPAMSYGGEEHDSGRDKATVGVEALSHELRDLLTREMKALQTGMMSIIPAYVAGKWHEIETTARKMKESYLLKQNLTKSQAKELHSVLPHGFVEKDLRFHHLAGLLEHAAKSENAELVGFYFYKMGETCVGCHTDFASHVFPDLTSKQVRVEHEH